MQHDRTGGISSLHHTGNIAEDSWQLFMHTQHVEESEIVLYPPFYQKIDSKYVCLQNAFFNPKRLNEIGQICQSPPQETFSDFILHLCEHHNMHKLQADWICLGCESIHTCKNLFDHHIQLCLHASVTWSALQNYVIIFF